MKGRNQRLRRLIGPLLFAAAIVLCFSALYAPWWALNEIVYVNGQPGYCENYWTTVFSTGSYDSNCGGSAPPTSPQGATPLEMPDVETLTETSVGAAAFGALLSIFAIGFAVYTRPGQSPHRGVATLVLVIGLLAAGACFTGATYFVVELPNAFQTDNFTIQTGDPYPPTFFGHAEYSSNGSTPSEVVTASLNWGPTTGWYLPWVGGALMAAASILSWRSLRIPRWSTIP